MNDYIVLVDESGQPYISHHGIKGQKWGVRRFQNPDGTRTEAGKERRREPNETNQRIKTAIKVAAVVAGAAAVAYGGYKLNAISVDSLQKQDLANASEWLQKQDLLTEKVDRQFHESLRLRTVLRNGENLGDILATSAREDMAKANAASEMYKYYTKKARTMDYDVRDRIDELKRLIKT